ncbi:7TM diverse intracellular signaling domain-containing protein [Paradesertivirga mongoliensis]|uniref:7TM diverse intracellular signaling domain-containing protein n=1 Tax=Paradesertivirga mongoliensis TaxID=2100740 RepID=A0ABW4ZKN8_9SPHI|nr:7TM diverse intracellular signaling domain-containing protein [Pedobacter mongoliensis]
MRKTFLFVCVMLLHYKALAADTLTIASGNKQVLVGKHLGVFEDPSGILTIDDMLRKDDQFEPVNTAVPVFTTQATYVWARLILKNKTGKDLWLYIGNPTTDSVLYYEKSYAHVISKLSGDKVPLNHRDIKSNRILFNISYTDAPTTVYLRFNIRLPRQFPIAIISSDAFNESGNLVFFLDGLFYGLIAVIVIYNLFLWIMIRDRSYIFYIGYIMFSGILLMHFDGITYAYLWPSYQGMNDHPAILASVPMFFAAFFVSEFLNLRQNFPLLLKGLWVFCAVWTCCCVISLSGGKFLALSISQTTAFFAALYFLLTGVLIYKRGYTPARYYLAGWTVLITGILVFLSKDMGWIGYNIFTANSLKIGTAAEAVLMAFALADRINFYKSERNKFESEKVYEQTERIRVESELKVAETLLLNYTENLRQKNNLIEQFKNDLEQMELKLKGTELGKGQSEHIEKLLQSIILTEDDWNEFRKLFDKVHQGYIYRIKSKYSNLTESDIRHIALLKLQLNSREMASMLGVTVEAVRKAKQRLRKKVDFHDSNLEELVAGI